ncbi:MAG: DUF2802 domain-containing protein [Rhodocyclaceae bacterium]
MDAFALGWRDGILLLVVLAAIYLAVLVFKLIQIGRPRSERPLPLNAPRAGTEKTMPPRSPLVEPKLAETATPRVSATVAASAYAEEAAAHEAYVVPPAPTFEWNPVLERGGAAQAAPEAPAAMSAEWPRGRGDFGESLADHLARSEVEMEVQRMRDEIARMRAEVEELRAARRVSPQYAEAMELVQRGLSAQQVADRLGISLAEAELVQALARGESNFDEGDGHGGEGDGANDGYDAFGPGGRR